MAILEKIHTHADLENLSPVEQARLCTEIREFLVSHIAKTGGHLASNLGVVELSVAIETVFDTARDRLVFDVGHQSYVHKLLTGRVERFDSLRQLDGMAGFPKPCESETDAFVAGHASSSVSVALGMARARTLRKETYHVVALLGDGAATGGMAYEGLNDAAVSREPMVVILNDNEMSIDRSVGGMARHLSRLRTKERYLGMKVRFRNLMKKLPGGMSFFRFAQKWKNRLKRFLLPTTVFENMGMDYLGPVDGHDLPELIRILRVARDMKTPVLVHVLTQKGRGYHPAEADPAKFHGVGKFDPTTGVVEKSCGVSFSHAFGEKLVELAKADSRVCAITAAMPGGTGLLDFHAAFPDRLFDVGIAEEHAVSMAGGLAKQGMVPVVAIYSTFLQRAFDQILQDVSILHLHVVFAVDRAGLVGEDGETHHGVFDVGYLRQAPGMMILCPCCCHELSQMLEWAVEEYEGPVAIRYPRGCEPAGLTTGAWENRPDLSAQGALTCHRKGKNLTLICYGSLIGNVLEAAALLSAAGIEATVLRLLTAAPLPVEAIAEQLAPGAPVVIVEETASGSGIGESLAYELGHIRPDSAVYCRNLGKKFIKHGCNAQLYQRAGLDGQGIAAFCREVCRNED